MPRSVRNFWLELDVDGSTRKIETGPRSSHGGFRLVVKMRDKGGIETPALISGRCTADGRLVLEANWKGCECVPIVGVR
jgi:hypothetical protein